MPGQEGIGIFSKALGAPGCFRQVRQDKMGILESFLGRIWADGLKEVNARWPWGDRLGARGTGRYIYPFSECDAERREVRRRGGVVEVSLSCGEPWGMQARGVGVGSGVWAGREGTSERQVVLAPC